MVITIENVKNSLEVIFTEKFLTEVALFCCFDVCSVQPHLIFKVEAKISTVPSVFPDYLSVFYDYDIIHFMIYSSNN